MSTKLVIPVSQRYVDLNNEIHEELKNPQAKPQTRRVTKVTDIFIEEVMQILIFDLVEEVGFQPFAKKLILNVGNVVQKAIQLLVDKIIAKLGNKDLKPFIAHFTGLQAKDGEQNYVGVELTAEEVEQLETCWRNIDEGNHDKVRKELQDFLQLSFDKSVDAYIKIPMSLVGLGLIAKKILDGVYFTLDKAVPPAIHKIVSGMNQQELEEFKEFFDKMILRD